MSKPQRIALFVGLLTIAALIFAATRSREPSYQGKKLSEWLDEINFGDWPDKTSAESQFAIRRMGTNTLPFLLSRLRSENSSVKLKLAEWAEKQDFIRIQFHNNDQDRMAAVAVFQILGPIGNPAIPDLQKMLNEAGIHHYAVAQSLRFIGVDAIPALTNTWSHANPTVRWAGFTSLADLGTNAAATIPFLAAALKSDDPEIRIIAARSMWSVGRNHQTIAIPELMKALDDPHANVKAAVIHALHSFGHNANSAVPKLTGFLDQREFAGDVTLALAAIMGTNECIPLVTNALNSTDAVVQRFLIECLGTFQSEAREATPALLPFARGENARLRHVAIQALIKIGADAETMVPILVKELADTDSTIRGEVLNALAEFGPKASAAEQILLEQIEVLKKNGGQFSGSPNPIMMRGFASGPGSAMFDSLPFLEFFTLQKINPAAADKIKKQFEKEKLETSKK